MTERSLMIDLNDPRTEKIADAISNKTAKKILGLLAEKELSESELAKELGMALNTIEYNIRKLEEAGLIEKLKGFLWSVKGKRIHRYKISNKRIVISPRRMIKGIIPSVLISGAIALGIKIWTDRKVGEEYTVQRAGEASDMVLEKSVAITEKAGATMTQTAVDSGVVILAQNIWLWFFAGALAGLLIYLIWNHLGKGFK